MSWRGDQDSWRRRSLAKYDAAEVEDYESLVGTLSPEEEDAYLSDLRRVLPLSAGMRVLDVGAGTGTVCGMLSRLDGLSITALEPAPAMLAKLRAKPRLAQVVAVEGFCDAREDREHFGEAQFDAILSRQLGNVLFDPLAAFRNWYQWLAPGGAAVVMDGGYARSAWSGRWEEEVDALPLSAHQTTALVPYLLESVGFRVEAVEPMAAANALAATRTPRYVVAARKPAPEAGGSRSA